MLLLLMDKNPNGLVAVGLEVVDGKYEDVVGKKRWGVVQSFCSWTRKALAWLLI